MPKLFLLSQTHYGNGRSDPIGCIVAKTVEEAIRKTGLRRSQFQSDDQWRKGPKGSVRLIGKGDELDNGDWEIRPMLEITSPNTLKELGLQ